MQVDMITLLYWSTVGFLKGEGKFKFHDSMIDCPEEAVQKEWVVKIKGVRMYQVWCKLNHVRKTQRHVTKYIAKASQNVVGYRENLDKMYSILRNDPLTEGLLQEMNEARELYKKWNNIEEKILQQQTKIH